MHATYQTKSLTCFSPVHCIQRSLALPPSSLSFFFFAGSYMRPFALYAFSALSSPYSIMGFFPLFSQLNSASYFNFCSMCFCTLANCEYKTMRRTFTQNICCHIADSSSAANGGDRRRINGRYCNVQHLMSLLPINLIIKF